MQVEKIFFVDSIPGQPIYFMRNGEIRIPFPDGKTGAMLWITEDDAIKSLTTKSKENKKIVHDQFDGIRKQMVKSHSLNIVN